MKLHHGLIAILLTFAACGSSKPSEQDCQQALDHLADVAEKGQNKIPHDRYIAENKKDFVRSCQEGTKAEVDCWMKMTDISGEEWAKCSKP